MPPKCDRKGTKTETVNHEVVTVSNQRILRSAKRAADFTPGDVLHKHLPAYMKKIKKESQNGSEVLEDFVQPDVGISRSRQQVPMTAGDTSRNSKDSKRRGKTKLGKHAKNSDQLLADKNVKHVNKEYGGSKIVVGNDISTKTKCSGHRSVKRKSKTEKELNPAYLMTTPDEANEDTFDIQQETDVVVESEDCRNNQIKTCERENSSSCLILAGDGKNGRRYAGDGKNRRQDAGDEKNSRQDAGDGKNIRQDAEDSKNSRQDAIDGKNSRQDAGDDKNSRQDAGDGKNSRQDAGDGKNSRLDAVDGKNSRLDAGDDKNSRQYAEDGKNSRLDAGDDKNSRHDAEDGKNSRQYAEDGKKGREDAECCVDEQVACVLDKTSKGEKFVGAHTSIQGGLQNAVHNAVAIGAKAFGLFLRSQRQWICKPLLDETAESFRRACKENNFPAHLILPHGSYLINCGAPNPETLLKSREALVDELKRCEKLGLLLYNFHPGSSCGAVSVECCLQTVADTINYAHEQTTSVITVIENMSCQGNTVGGKFEELKGIIELVKDKSRVGVCIDTCHAFAAGYDLSCETGFNEMMADFDKMVGFDYLRAVHLNDSKGYTMKGEGKGITSTTLDNNDIYRENERNELLSKYLDGVVYNLFAEKYSYSYRPGKVGCHLDRHENIGKGYIGTQGFHRIMNDPRFNNIPMILETPPELDDSEEIQLLNGLCGQ